VADDHGQEQPPRAGPRTGRSLKVVQHRHLRIANIAMIAKTANITQQSGVVKSWQFLKSWQFWQWN
jgi:hypothetical protein